MNPEQGLDHLQENVESFDTQPESWEVSGDFILIELFFFTYIEVFYEIF